MEDLISIIVPVYNCAKYLGDCAASVLAQSYGHFELLLVDDGSTDGGRELCEKLCRQDGRIHLLCQSHKGVSAARNAGMKRAAGKYLFFLDSDDMIHPLLLETLYRQQEEEQAVIASADCCYIGEGRFRIPEGQEPAETGAKGRYRLDSEEAVRQICSVDRTELLFMLGGKMIRAEAAKKVRFAERLTHGEDTLFLYRLLSEGADITVLCKKWYYYRRHEGSASVHFSAPICKNRYRVYRYIRERELRRGKTDNAGQMEIHMLEVMIQWYIIGHDAGDIELQRYVKKLAAAEKGDSFYQRNSRLLKLRFSLAFHCYPVYRLLRLLYIWYYSVFGSGADEKAAGVGIITFHCADNFGAMLQAYGLKHYLRGRGIAADIVRYEPPFMTGRHWLFPYLPTGSIRRRLWRGLAWGIGNLRMGRAYFVRRANMRRFRETYLVGKRQGRCLFSGQLKRLPYSCYIVGSDQIWNPDITCGLRPVYFGVFDNKNKQKVVAYGASIGGVSLAPQYDKEFSALIQNLDAVSVREEEALPYIERFYRGPVTAVLDPVFLLKREQWQKIERKPKRGGYILFYAVEQNKEMTEYAKRLGERTGLAVIELRSSGGGADRAFETDCTAGPAEFLGYIHMADYVVTNSLHGTAFSIIYRKKFIVFLHKSLGARIRSILKLHGLEDRLYEKGRKFQFFTDWEDVEKRTARHVMAAGQFLLEQTGCQAAVPRNGE